MGELLFRLAKEFYREQAYFGIGIESLVHDDDDALRDYAID